MKTTDQLVDMWMDQNIKGSMEGSSGVRRFEKLCEAIGYREGNFLGSEVAIQNFLADNSGAIEALIDWIKEQDCEDWNESLADSLDVSLEDDEDDDDEDDDNY